MEISNTFSYGSTDGALVRLLGEFIRHQRLQQNKTQESVARLAGINRTTLVEFENGRNASLLTFIQLLRVLGQLHTLETFVIRNEISPLMLAEMQHQVRRRASRPRKAKKRKR
jgi:transcriptional regulator with XRE-family HTH domain